MTTTIKTISKERSRLDPEPIARRDFLGVSARLASLGALVFALVGAVKMPKTAVLPSPNRQFKVKLPQSLPIGTAYVPQNRKVAVFRDDDGVYAISLVCTHLGCIVKPVGEGFDCPCHGSKFNARGEVLGGPAPKALPWHAVSTVDSDTVLVDEGEIVVTGTKVS